ncbi:MAG: CHASE2 domain-containing protein [Thermosynechococcaceae cyanobacterium]
MRVSLKQLYWQGRGIWIAAPSITALVIVMRFVGVLQAWEWSAFDQYQRWRPQPTRDQRIVIVGINELDIRRLQASDLSDRVYAQLITKLKAMQPRAIGLDIYRDLPVEPGHAELVKLFESTPNLVGIEKVLGKQNVETVAPPPALKKLGQVGANDFILDADNRVRRGLIYTQNPADAKGEKVFSFGFHLALHYLAKDRITPKPIEGTKARWHFGKTLFAPFEANDGGYMRADAGGFQMVLNYRGPRDSFETVSLTDVLAGRIAPDWGRDRIIIIGKIGDSFKDTFFTPYSGGLLDLPEPMPGVEIHAHLTSQIISAALGERPLFRSGAEPLEWLWILLWSGVGATLTWQLRYRDGVQALSLSQSLSLFLAGGILFGSTFCAFLAGWWLPVVPPFMGLMGAAIAITAYIARTASQIRRTFGRYLSDQVVAHVLENPEGLHLGGQRRQITMLSSDLRGFTSLAERLSPEQVVKILNLYLKHMAQVILAFHGTIDDYLGDGIAVLFGAPESRADDATRAVACALAMQLEMKSVNKTLTDWGFSTLEMGIGINTGEVVLGNIGSEQRTKYSAIGSQMNLTFRIESYTVGRQIYVSESTLEAANRSLVEVKAQQIVQPKGVQQPITLYEVVGMGGTYGLSLDQEVEHFLTLPIAIPLQYTLLENKKINGEPCWGVLTRLSGRGAEIQSEDIGLLADLTNVKINLGLTAREGSNLFSQDIYAKVVSIRANHFQVIFTAVPPEVEAELRSLHRSQVRPVQ